MVIVCLFVPPKVKFLLLDKEKGAGYPAKESFIPLYQKLKFPLRICNFDVIIAFFTTIYAFLWVEGELRIPTLRHSVIEITELD